MAKLIFAILISFSSFAMADSTSGSCSGTAVGLGYYYVYTYQNANLINGKIVGESHSFSFSGFLSDMKNATLVSYNEKHVIYKGSEYYMAVPYKSGAGFYIKKPDQIQGPGSVDQGWIKLCNY